jgi:predicted transcriptional regulator
MTTLKMGIASYEGMKARTMAVARGKRRVAGDEPKVWFTSTESFAKIPLGRESQAAARYRRQRRWMSWRE